MLNLSYADVAERLGVSTQTVRRMVAAGRIPPPRRVSPGLVRFDEREFETWRAQRPIARPRAANA